MVWSLPPGASGVIGPMLAARILDSTGSYNTSYIVSAVLLVIAGAYFPVRNFEKNRSVGANRQTGTAYSKLH